MIGSSIARWRIALLSILGLGLLLRLWNIDFGLPFIYTTDEWFEVKRALKLGAGGFDFDRVAKGGYYFVLFVLYGIYYVALRVVGAVDGSREFLLSFFNDPTPIWMIGRVTSTIVGTVNCLLVYGVGKRAYSRGVGVAAAAFMAIHVTHVTSSHHINVDAPLTACLTACLLVMHWYKPEVRGTAVQYVALGLCVTAALLNKLSAVPIFFSCLLFHFKDFEWRLRPGKIAGHLLDRRLVAFAVVMLVSYLGLNPGMIVNAVGVFEWALSFFLPAETVQFQPEFPQLYERSESVAGFYLTHMFPLRYVVVALLFGFGLVLAVKRKPLRNHYGLLFLVAYAFFLMASKSTEHIYERYLLPLTPVIWVYVGVSLEAIYSATARRRPRAAVPLIGAIALLAALPLLYDTVRFDLELGRPDTRTRAERWFRQEVPAGSVVYLEGGLVSASGLTVPLKMDPSVVDRALSFRTDTSAEEDKSDFYEVMKESLASRRTYHLVLIDNTDQLENALERGLGDYVVLRDKTAVPFVLESNRVQFPTRYRLVSWVESDDWELIRTFEPDETTRGPNLLIYRRRASRISAAASARPIDFRPVVAANSR